MYALYFMVISGRTEPPTFCMSERCDSRYSVDFEFINWAILFINWAIFDGDAPCVIHV